MFARVISSCCGVDHLKCLSLLQVALKALSLPTKDGLAAFEEQVQMLWHISADSHHICRIYGVSCLNGHAVLVMKLYPHSLASKITFMTGQLHCPNVFSSRSA